MSLIETYFPFYRFNLTRNPFGTLDDSERMRVIVPPEPLEQAMQQGFEHLLVMGRKGRGKSTTLHYVLWHARAAGLSGAYERLPRWMMTYQTDTAPLDVFALDEMQRLAPWEMFRLFNEMRGKRLWVGSHADHRPAFWLCGLDVTVIRLNAGASRGRLAKILHKRLTAFIYDENAPLNVGFSEDAVDWLWARYGSDLRNMNFFLYDVFGKLQDTGEITAAQLAHAAAVFKKP